MKKGFLSFILHLAPSNLSGYNVCPMASIGCIFGCLNTAGRGGFDPRIPLARIRKTVMFMEQRETFMAMLVKDIEAGIRSAKRKRMRPVFRLNGTSDIRWETGNIFPEDQPNMGYAIFKVDAPNATVDAPVTLNFDLAQLGRYGFDAGRIAYAPDGTFSTTIHDMISDDQNALIAPLVAQEKMNVLTLSNMLPLRRCPQSPS
jgi:hypothetical protein